MELVDALNAAIDARLIEVGLMEDPSAKPAKGGKAAKGKGKDKAEEAADEEITMESLKAKMTQLVNASGKPAAIALLKKAKVEKLNELPEKHWAKFDELLTAALPSEEASDDDLFGE